MKKQKFVKGIKLTIEEDFLKKFEAVKEYLGLENDAEVVRYLVNAFYRDVVLPKLEKHKDKEDQEIPKYIVTDRGEL